MASILLPILLATAAVAFPPPAGYGFCSTVNKKISVAGEQSVASAYCSSYLHIPVHTSKVVRTKTVTITTSVGKCTRIVTAPETTSVVTSTITSIAETVSFSATTTVTDVITNTPEATSIKRCQMPFATPDPRKKRSVQDNKPKKPKCLSEYTAQTAVSSACSCVSVRASTTTVATKTSTILKTVVAQNENGVRTTTPIKRVTSLVTTIQTASTTTTFTERTTSTTEVPVPTVNAVRPPTYFGIGAWQPGGAFNGFYVKNNDRPSSDPANFVDLSSEVPTPFTFLDGTMVDYKYYPTPYPGGADPNSPYQDPSRITFAHSRDAVDSSIAVGRLSCNVEVKADYMCYLNCALGDKTTNYVCADGSWYIGTDTDAKEGCEKFTPLIVQVPWSR